MKDLSFRTRTVVVAAVAIGLSVNVSQGSVVIRVTESGGNLVVTTSGSIDFTGLSAGHTSTAPTLRINHQGNYLAFGVGAQLYFNVPDSVFEDHGFFGMDFSTSTVALTSGGGDVGFQTGPTPFEKLMWLPGGYVSGTPINQVLTITGESFASIGVEDGDYATYSWGGANPDSITFAIGSAVPVELQSFVVE